MTNDTNYLLSQATAQLKEISAQHLDEDNRREDNLKSSSNSEEKLRLSTIHDRFKNELEHLQSSQSTYLNDPDQARKFNFNFKQLESGSNLKSCHFLGSLFDLHLRYPSLNEHSQIKAF